MVINLYAQCSLIPTTDYSIHHHDKDTLFRNHLLHKLPVIRLRVFTMYLLNQAHAGLRLAHAWFFKIDPVQIVGMRACMRVCVCVSAPEAINYQWRDVA